jgi:hypothetical protein
MSPKHDRLTQLMCHDRSNPIRFQSQGYRKRKTAPFSFRRIRMLSKSCRHFEPQDPKHMNEAIRLLTASLRAGFGFDYIELDHVLDPIRETAEFKRVQEASGQLQWPVRSEMDRLVCEFLYSGLIVSRVSLKGRAPSQILQTLYSHVQYYDNIYSITTKLYDLSD